MPFTALDIVTDALLEIGAYGPGENLSNEDAQIALRRFNSILDQWSARKLEAYAQTFNLYTITPNHQPHLIGPGLSAPDWAATQRPVKIVGADVVLSASNPATDIPLLIKDDQWWLNNRTKSVTSILPTHLYYSPDFPNGSVYLWPIPTAANQIRLETWGLLSQMAALTTAFVNPPGYRRAITLTLAEDLCVPFKQTDLLEAIAIKASRARAIIIGPNSAAPTIETVDSGQPNTNTRGGFNWMTGDFS